MIRVLALVLAGIVAACAPAATASPSPTASAFVAASPSPTPVPTTAPQPPTSASRYENAVLGYAVTLPSPWRRSDCMSRVTTTRDATTIGNDTFTWRTVADEQAVGGGGDVVVTGAGAWAIGVYVESSWLTPADYAKTRGGSAGDVLQPTTLDGKPAARTVDASGTSVAHYVANAGRMYSIALTRGFDARPPLVTDATLDLIARSITFMTPAARPTPTPAPTFTPAVEALADAVAAAFAASDADRLHDVMPAACWFFSASYDGGGAAVSRDVFAANLRTSFVQGRRVSVEPRPIKADAPLSGSFWIWSTWSAYGTQPFTPQSTVQLVFGQIDGRWYWVAAMFNATR